MAQWMGIEERSMRQGIDGCGLPTFAMPLDAVAADARASPPPRLTAQPGPAAIFAR